MRPDTAPAKGLVPMLSLAAFVNHLNLIAWNPFLPSIAEAHGVTVALLGQVPALMLLLSASLGLVIGPLADRYGYRRAEQPSDRTRDDATRPGPGGGRRLGWPGRHHARSAGSCGAILRR